MKFSNLKIVIFEIFIIVIFSVLLYQVSINNNQIYKATNDKLSMLKAADRLRQSSDDLTHFARTYVITADEKYKKQYFDTLDIRNGKKPRPQNYHSIYWDLDESIRYKNHKDTSALSLDSIFASLPYDKKEIENLELSKANSDDLVNLEIEAFNAMEGKFKDDSGKYTIISKPNQKLAIELMHSKEYYMAKHRIMKPIDEFILMLDKRTTLNINDIHNKSKPLDMFLFIVALIFLVGNYYILQYLNNQEKQKLEEKNALLQKQKELNLELVKKSEITLKLNRELEESEHELQLVNENLELRVQEEFEKNRQKDKLLSEQSKMASMGEMLENIAHQWRQPLSVISTAASGIILKKTFGHSTEEYETESLEAIVKNTKHLSKTIDDFRDFFKPNKEKKHIFISEVIEKTLAIVSSKFKNREIKVHKDIDEIEIDVYDNELIQVIMNIFKNSQDILETLPAEDRNILIYAKKLNDKMILNIKDSGGGIENEILHKVFEPYFTTKHKSQGTGIGLYMTEIIIVKHMHGKIDVRNENFTFEKKNYKGASFIIELPLDK